MAEVVELKLVSDTKPNTSAIALVEEMLERLRSGKSCAVAIVEVYANGDVGTYFSEGEVYHHLCSGAARLATRIALD